jgi:hypothetical protein
LRRIVLGDPSTAWARLGFAVAGGECRIGGVTLELGGAGGGFAGWSLEGGGAGDVDGLATGWAAAERAETEGAPHPNGARSIDHVVLSTGSLARTTGALEAAGAEVRRVAERGGRRQAFLWLGDVICEVVEAPAPGAPARFWGLTVVVADLDTAVAAAPAAFGPAREAVQPGRRIAPARREAGLGVALALITPHRRTGFEPGSD